MVILPPFLYFRKVKKKNSIAIAFYSHFVYNYRERCVIFWILKSIIEINADIKPQNTLCIRASSGPVSSGCCPKSL